MPGFLKVFGHPNPKNPIGYGIDVRGRPVDNQHGIMISDAFSSLCFSN